MPNTVYEDLLKWSKTIDVTGDIDPQSRRILRELEARCNCPYDPNDTLEGVIEIQTLNPGDRTSGTFDLRLRRSLQQFPFTSVLVITDPLVWNVAAAVVQTEVDAVAPGSWPNYQTGDIEVTGGATGAGGSDITLTYSGDEVHGHQVTPGVGDIDLAGGTTNPSITTPQNGQSAQFWFAALKAMGVITGTDPVYSDTPAGQYTVHSRGNTENYPSQETIKALVYEASVQENEDWMTELLVPLNIAF